MFIHSFNLYFLSTCCVPGPILGMGLQRRSGQRRALEAGKKQISLCPTCQVAMCTCHGRALSVHRGRAKGRAPPPPLSHRGKLLSAGHGKERRGQPQRAGLPDPSPHQPHQRRKPMQTSSQLCPSRAGAPPLWGLGFLICAERLAPGNLRGLFLPRKPVVLHILEPGVCLPVCGGRGCPLFTEQGPLPLEGQGQA